MIADFRTDDVGSLFQADICVIGAGPAGITIARDLIGSGLQVCLVESGGLDFDEVTQTLYQGSNIGLPYYDLDVSRLRYFGGSTNHWNGQSAPMDEHDFKVRSWVPHSGWPITRGDLDAYYPRAQEICGLGPFTYDDTLTDLLDIENPKFRSEKIELGFWQFSEPILFGEAYRQELKMAENVRVLLFANVINIETDDSGSTVEWVDIRSIDGKAGRIEARAYVLACGGIENARILLLSNKKEAKGVGNRHDLVGRFFMEHMRGRCAVMMSEDPRRILGSFRRHWLKGIQYWARLILSETQQTKSQVLNCAAQIGYESDPESGVTAAIQIARGISRGRWPDDLGEKIWRIAKDLDEVLPNAYRYFIDKKEPIATPKLLYLSFVSEQAPNPDSRVILSDKRDSLGLNQASLDWRVTELTRRTVAELTTTLGAELGRLNLARVRLESWLSDENMEWAQQQKGSYHHIGTTRMAREPKQGVVDGECRVHGINNLFIAGSSVFSTSGYVNPTLTIVALALRLADHLNKRLN